MKLDAYKAMKLCLNNLDNEKPIYVAGHINTDYDSVCSSLALTRFLRLIGKNAFMLLEDKDLSMLDWFGDTNYILNDITDPEKPYNFIQLDGNRLYRLGLFEKHFKKADIRINIDHHEGNFGVTDDGYTNVLAISELSSTAEILCKLFEEFDTKYDDKIASLLFGGIVSDTYSFLQRTTTETMNFASKLLALGIDNQYIIKSVYLDKNDKELAILKSMLNNLNHYERFDCIVMDTSKEPFDGDVYNIIFKKCITTVQNIANQEVLALFLLNCEKDGKRTINGEFRCNTDLDVAELATKFGGGGHKNASGFSTDKSLDEVLEITTKYLSSK